MNRTVTVAATLLLVIMTGFLLVQGRGLLMPIIIALFIWHLVNTINQGIRALPFAGARMPQWLSLLCALLVLVMLARLVFDILGSNINQVIAAAPRYQENLLSLFNRLDERLHIRAFANVDAFLENLSVQSIVLNVYGVFTSLASSAVLIALYVVFLFVEQHFFWQKIRLLFAKKGHLRVVNNIISHIVRDTQTYLGIKTLVSAVTAVASWSIMKAVGLDFAEFWALLIFFLNFIPNIGAIIATAFPALLAMVQFDGGLPFVAMTLGIISVQFVIGNLIEPRFMGKSLNVSPLAILFALTLWGAIWGVLGMFLSVPITVMLMIVCAHFEKTRPIAVLLSQDGHIFKAYEEIA